MNYYNEIKNKIIDNEVYSKIKDYSKEKHSLLTHYEVGKLLLEASTKYGDDIIGNYSKKLMNHLVFIIKKMRFKEDTYNFFKFQLPLLVVFLKHKLLNY